MEKILAQQSTPAFEFLTSILEGKVENGQTGWDMIGARLGAPARDPVEALLSRALAHDAQSASSLQTFLADLERDDSEIKRDLEVAGNAIRVMTVHGAKGLQAPVVILPETTGKTDPKAGDFFHVVEGAVPIRAGKKDDDTPEMAAARAEAEAKERLEYRRLLYVALTRAQDRLLICGPWYGKKPQNSKNTTGRPKFSWHEMCEAGLRALGIDVPEAGGEAVTYGKPPLTLPRETMKYSAAAPIPDWLRRTAPREERTLRYIAPTSLKPGEAPVLPPFRRGHGARLSRGRLIHALLQRLPDIPPTKRRAAGENFLASDGSLAAVDRQGIIEASIAVLEDPSFSEVFQLDGRAEAPIVGTSEHLPDGVIINGRVDRLVVTDDEVLIIDFKTDRPPPQTPDQVGESYIAQMAAYKAVPDRYLFRQGGALRPALDRSTQADGTSRESVIRGAKGPS